MGCISSKDDISQDQDRPKSLPLSGGETVITSAPKGSSPSTSDSIDQPQPSTQPAPPSKPQQIQASNDSQTAQPSETIQSVVSQPPTEEIFDGTYNKTTFFKGKEIISLLKDNKITKEKLLELFDIMDENNDGCLNEKEYFEIVSIAESSYEYSMKPIDENSSNKQPEPTSTTSTSLSLNSSIINASNHTSNITSEDDGAKDSQLISPTRARKPAKKIVHSPKPSAFSSDETSPLSSPTTPSKSKAGALDDYSEMDEEIKPPKPPRVNNKPVPAMKKGFLKIFAQDAHMSVSSPGKHASKYQVLDAGKLYHMDTISGIGSPKGKASLSPFAIDRKGISLAGRKMFVNDNSVDLSPMQGQDEYLSAEDENNHAFITIEFKSYDEKEQWIHAINEHIEYATF